MDGVHPNSALPRSGDGQVGSSAPRLSARQRWYLSQLGLPVWRLRPSAAELRAAEAAATVAPAPAAPPAAEAGHAEEPAPQAEIRVSESTTRSPSTPAEHGRRDHREVARATPEPATQVSLDLVCVRQGVVLLLAPAAAVAREAALVRDLLGAAQALLGGPAAAPEEFRFFWPQPGSRGTPERALAAFLDKRRDDAGARLLLLCQSTAAWVPESPVHTVAIAALETLALSPSHKRDLWQALWQRQPTTSP